MVDPRDAQSDAAAVTHHALVGWVVTVATGEATDPAVLLVDDKWVERAAQEGVLLAVVAAMRATGMSTSPELDRVRTSATLRSLALKQDLRVIAEAFERAEVTWVLVKGPVLGEIVYERPGSRESFDVDVVVRPAQLRHALRALDTIGARRIGVDWTQRTWAKGCEVPLQMPSGTIIDLHWNLLNRPGLRRAYGLTTESLLERRVTRDLGSVSAPGLDDLDTVLHVLLHSCSDGCGRLRALLDAQQCVAWLARRGWRPEELAERAAERGLEAPAWLVLSLARDLLDPEMTPWCEVLRSTAWTRSILRLSRRPGRGPGVHVMTRRLVRYTAPSTRSSAAGVGGYALSRLVRLVRPDDTRSSGFAGERPDPAFERFLERAR